MSHGAIQTEYGGYLFRSRLEARWAVFFDTLDIQWKYETQGYEVDGHRYLPDFYLPATGTWVEVKGDPHGLSKDVGRMRAVLSAHSPLPGIAEGESFLLVLGDVPTENEGTVLHQAFSHDLDGPRGRWSFFYPKGTSWEPHPIEPTIVLTLLSPKIRAGVIALAAPSDWLVRHQVLPTPIRFGPVFDAYRAARQARFEHGVHGR